MSWTVHKRLMVLPVFAGTSIDTSDLSVVVYVFVLLVSTLKEDVAMMSVEKVVFVPEPKYLPLTCTDALTLTAKENPVPILKVDEVDIAVVSHFVRFYGFECAVQMTGRKP